MIAIAFSQDCRRQHRVKLAIEPQNDTNIFQVFSITGNVPDKLSQVILEFTGFLSRYQQLKILLK